MQREESSCAEHCFNCDLRLSFSSSNFLKFSFDCSPIKETKPRWRCYLRLLQKPLLLPSHTAPPCTPCISGLLCPPHLSFSPSLPSLLKSEHPQPLYPTRPSWAQVWPWILIIPRLPRFSSPSFLSFFLPVGISRALAAVASPALYSFSAAPVSPPATWFPPEAVLLDCIWRRLASCSEKTNTGLQVRHHIFAEKTPSSDNCAQGWLK